MFTTLIFYLDFFGAMVHPSDGDSYQTAILRVTWIYKINKLCIYYPVIRIVGYAIHNNMHSTEIYPYVDVW